MGGDTVVQAPDPPPQRDIGKETRDNLEAQIELAPERYAMEAEYRPLYAQLARQLSLENLGINGDKGMLQALIQDIVPAQNKMKRTSVAGDIETMETLGGKLIEAQRSIDPQAEEVRKELATQAQEGLTNQDNTFKQLSEYNKERLNSGDEDLDLVQSIRKDRLNQDNPFNQSNELSQQLIGVTSNRLKEDPFSALIKRGTQRLDNDQMGSVIKRNQNLFDQLSGRLSTDSFDDYISTAKGGVDSANAMVQDAKEQLQSGTGLTAQEARLVDQGVLEAMAERGMEDQASTLEMQIKERLSGDRGLQSQRRQDLASALGAQQSANQAYGGAIATKDAIESGRYDSLGSALDRLGGAVAGADQSEQMKMDTLTGAVQGQDASQGQRINALAQAIGLNNNVINQAVGYEDQVLSGIEQGAKNNIELENSLVNALSGSAQNELAYDQTMKQNAQTAYNMSNFDILQALTGRSGMVPGQAQSGFGSAGFTQSAGPTIFNPESGYGNALNAGNQNANIAHMNAVNQANIANAQNSSNMFGGLLGFGGGLLGGLF